MASCVELEDKHAHVLQARLCTTAGVVESQDDEFYHYVLEGLSKKQLCLNSKHLYDDKGSLLFEDVCELDEYYLTRTELAILEQNIDEISCVIGPNAIVLEPGSGAGVKIKLLLKALQSPSAYVPIEISSDALKRSTEILQKEFPNLAIYPVCGDFASHNELPLDLCHYYRIVFFPGSTIGNFDVPEFVRVLATFAGLAGNDGGLLIGVDLDKDPDAFLKAYNDSKGVSAAFALNILTRINRELGGTFDRDKFEYLVEYNEKMHRIEVRLSSRVDQLVHVRGHSFQFRKGESPFVGYIYKFRIAEFCDRLAAHGFQVQKSWTDDKKYFAVIYCNRDGRPSSLYDPDVIADSYKKTWSRSDQLFNMLMSDGLVQQPIEVQRPFIFYRGHLPGFAYIQTNCMILGKEAFSPELNAIFERGIDPEVTNPLQCHKHSDIPRQWPTAAEVEKYLQQCRKEILVGIIPLIVKEEKESTTMTPWIRGGRVHCFTIEHEKMHQETLMHMYMQLDVKYKRPHNDIKFDFMAQTMTEPKVVAIPKGSVRLGADFSTSPFGWDNEFPSFVVNVTAFQIDRYPVSNGEFHEFVSSGGYDNSCHWLEEEWKWKQKAGMKHPISWCIHDGQVFIRTLFGIEIPLAVGSSWPVCVTWAEACAYAHWKGGRLPSEAEWCRAAYGSPSGDDGRAYPWGNETPTSEHGNFNWHSWSPMPIGSHPKGKSAWEVEDLIGDGWEWTGTPFDPYEGFEPMSNYPLYSVDFFSNSDVYLEKHYVLKGGSFVTSSDLVRRSFRNFYQSHYPYMFTTFRLVYEE